MHVSPLGGRGELESDYHTYERNKAYKFQIGELWNIDFEAMWRKNVMDKYSRPYRDTKSGQWIGGYIQKRFEVDKWIPEDTNMQLKPGELRKPRPITAGNLQARMQAYRGNKKEVLNWGEPKDNFKEIKIS